MSDNCQGCPSAGDCGGSCGETAAGPTPAQLASKIGAVVAVASGKGGVGKSTVSAMLAVLLRRQGKRVGILDADVTGPSIPKMFGLTDKVKGTEEGLYPLESSTGIKVMSLNLVIPNEDDPVIWRGPIVGQLVTQFWTEVFWGDLDYLILDLPPGTGDVPISIFQTIPVNGVVMVSNPQQLASMVVRKAVKMMKMYGAGFYGLVENMSYVKCADCGAVQEVFGPSRGEVEAKEQEMPFLGRLPLEMDLTACADKGRIEDYQGDAFTAVYQAFLGEESRVRELGATKPVRGSSL
ncbi:MAG: Mrp/NBP35 family ATP-binding protein [Gracilibacteraceae bacterium]|jgi:Mrp family chromosome partitioning ATPase|nr:Mrp/NBP35 family ATP-binding protein [Gracilibacteraceae bacterium]